MSCQFDALSFAARKRRRRLAQPQISQTNIIEYLQRFVILVTSRKKADRFAHRHIQNFVNVLAAITNVQNLLFKPRAFAFFANQFDVGEKLHLNRYRAVALANVAASARQIEGEV